MSAHETDHTDSRVSQSVADPERTPSWDIRLGQVKRVSARDAVSDQILTLIKSGALKPGDRLPSEQELIEMTKVSRSSVREAIRSLAAMQLVEIRPGKGTFVREVATDGVTDAQVLLMLADRKALEDLVDVRLALEPTIARLAAQRATADDIQALERALRAMNESTSNAEWRGPHLAFHQALAEATHNVILIKMWSLVAMFLKDSQMVVGAPTHRHIHDDLYQAVAMHDADRAVAAMQVHLNDMLRILAG